MKKKKRHGKTESFPANAVLLDDLANARGRGVVHLRGFFFQAEDGIRDADVTGVQTCALPIWPFSQGLSALFSERDSPSVTLNPSRARAIAGSEERRVGKECRCRWSPYHE